MKPQLTKKESVAAAFRAANIKGIDSHKRKLRDGADIGSKTSRRAQFIQKLWTMVNAPETAECVVWVDDGTAFTINDHDKFSTEILPFFFNHQNMASFERQMNFYSFQKMGIKEFAPSGKRFKRGSPVKFKHTYFRQDEPENLGLIVRKTCPLLHANMESELTDLNKELLTLRYERKHLESKLKSLKRFVATDQKDPAVEGMIQAARDVWNKVHAQERDAQLVNKNGATSHHLTTAEVAADADLNFTNCNRSLDGFALPELLDLDDFLAESFSSQEDVLRDRAAHVFDGSWGEIEEHLQLVGNGCNTPKRFPCKRQSSLKRSSPRKEWKPRKKLKLDDEPCRPLGIAPITLESLECGIDSFLSKDFSIQEAKLPCSWDDLYSSSPRQASKKKLGPFYFDIPHLLPEDLNVADLVSAWA